MGANSEQIVHKKTRVERMNILVTGGLGFIGLHTVRDLTAAGHRVRVLDCMAEPELREHNVQLNPGSTCFTASVWHESGTREVQGEIVLGDVRDPACCAQACDGMDVVVHCAAIHLSSEISASPVRSIEINVKGTVNILQAAVAAGVRRVVYLSSAKVYGQLPSLPAVEDALLCPLEPYGLTKVLGESHCARFHAKHGMETVILRPFSVYGPHQNMNNGYVGNAIKSICSGSAPLFPGDENFCRDFTYVDDMVEICMLAATVDDISCVTLNAGSGSCCTLLQLTELVNQMTGHMLQPVFRAPSPGTIAGTLADVRQLKAVLGFTPRVSLEEGLRRTIDWYRSSL
jgi:nucleoside-diphosphate-sugar epimerase